MTGRTRGVVALAIGLVTGLGAFGVETTPVRLEAGGPGWRRCVGGAGADGALRASAVVVVPGVDRGRPVRLLIDVEGGPANLGVSADRAEPVWLRVAGRATHLVSLQPTRVPGLHVALRLEPGGTPLRIHSLELRRETSGPWLARLLLALAAAGLATALPWAATPRLSLALALVGAGLLVLAASPLMLFWTLPSTAALVRVLVPVALLVAGATLGRGSGPPGAFAFGAAVLAAAVFGAWVRAYFLPSAGSWDVDYWKACALHTSAHGVARAYGDPESVPPGHFLAQLRGEEPAWELPAFGRTFVVDQPPGIQMLWKASWRLLSRVDHGMTPDEVLNVAVKLPAVAGDLLAAFVLLWAFGWTRKGFVLAALYWALPVSWLSSAVLGFFDGAYVPLAVAALVAAGRGRPGWAGALLAFSALVKSLALLMAPAVAVALWTARAPIRKAAAVGLATAAAAMVPFAVAGTLGTAVIHMFRIIFQLRLSGGYANLWWILGHLLTLGPRSTDDAVQYVRIEMLPIPVRPIATAAFALVAAWVVRCQLRASGARAAALAGAVLVLAYAQVAVGIHENHPHPFVLALFATGLSTRRLRLVAGVFFTTYVLNMLALSGLGRFYSFRYAAIDPLVKLSGAVRLGLGFDLTLALAVANVLGFAALLAWLPKEMEAASRPA